MLSTHGLDIDPRIYNEAMTLISAGHAIEVLSWDRENRNKSIENAEIDGIKIKRFFVKSKYGTGFKQAIAFIRIIYEVRKYLRGKKYDVIHGHDIDGAFIGTFLKKDKILIWDMRELYDGSNHGKMKSLIYNVFAWWCFFNIDGLITVIDYQLRRYKKKIKKDTICETILNTPEKKIFQNFNKKESHYLRISYIGSVRQFKELKLLMDSGLNIDGLKIQIHGSGAVLEKMIGIIGNYNNVAITGQFNYKETKYLYEDTDLLYVIYDKNIENQKYGIPIKGYEAIYTQTPVIAQNGTEFADFVKKHDIGFVIKGDDLDELRNLILTVKTNRALLKKKTDNIKNIQHFYLWENQAEKLKLFYQNLGHKNI
ncbi:MAG: glycosyltransferase [Lutibacter sp.]|jgi:glycosyltransferase involved in cell wall biosynthesis